MADGLVHCVEKGGWYPTQIDITLGKFTDEALDIVLTKIKSRNVAGVDEIPSEPWKTRKFDYLLLRLFNAVYKQNTIKKFTKSCSLHFAKKVDLVITRNYRGISLTTIAAKGFNALVLRLEIEKILRKNQNGFRINWSTTSLNLTVSNHRRSTCK